MSVGELDMVMGWATDEDCNPGLADADAFHAADTDGFSLPGWAALPSRPSRL